MFDSTIFFWNGLPARLSMKRTAFLLPLRAYKAARKGAFPPLSFCFCFRFSWSFILISLWLSLPWLLNNGLFTVFWESYNDQGQELQGNFPVDRQHRFEEKSYFNQTGINSET